MQTRAKINIQDILKTYKNVPVMRCNLEQLVMLKWSKPKTNFDQIKCIKNSPNNIFGIKYTGTVRYFDLYVQLYIFWLCERVNTIFKFNLMFFLLTITLIINYISIIKKTLTSLGTQAGSYVHTYV